MATIKYVTHEHKVMFYSLVCQNYFSLVPISSSHWLKGLVPPEQGVHHSADLC